MRYTPLCFVLVITVLLGGCTAPLTDDGIGQGGLPIVNGQLTSGDPATVYIDVGCTGTLVTPTIVLTACHCLEGVYGNVGVFFGSDINGSGTWISSVHHQVYPGACFGDGDLAMITLAQPGPTAPIPINDRDLNPHVGEPMRIVGFGVTSEYGGGSGTKREGWTTLAGAGQGQMWSNPSGQSGTCYGDSGGPNFMTFEGTEYVAGVTSYGTQACGSGQDAAARTDSHHDWLMQYIADHDPADCGADGLCASFCPVPDPDCPCADDGHCTDICPDWGGDPDCLGCGADGQCRLDCPALDTDCCIPNGECVAPCGDLDPDCGGGDPGSSGSSSGSSGGSSNGGTAGGDPGTPSAGQDPDGDPQGLVGVVSCALSGRNLRPPLSALWLWALAAGGLLQRRRSAIRRGDSR